MKPSDLGMDGYDISIDSRASILRSFTGDCVFFVLPGLFGMMAPSMRPTRLTDQQLFFVTRLFLWFTDVKLRKILVRVSY